VALLAWNGCFISAPEDGGRVYCLSDKAGEREMIQVGSSNISYFFLGGIAESDSTSSVHHHRHHIL